MHIAHQQLYNIYVILKSQGNRGLKICLQSDSLSQWEEVKMGAVGNVWEHWSKQWSTWWRYESKKHHARSSIKVLRRTKGIHALWRQNQKLCGQLVYLVEHMVLPASPELNIFHSSLFGRFRCIKKMNMELKDSPRSCLFTGLAKSSPFWT